MLCLMGSFKTGSCVRGEVALKVGRGVRQDAFLLGLGLKRVDGARCSRIIVLCLQAIMLGFNVTSAAGSVDRVLASEAKGRGFDPRQPRQIF